ncbi:TPA: hypothetical protein ACGI0P_000001, partial [Salmonella enterica]
KNKGHTAQPDMTTYTAYSEDIRMYCTGCGLDKLVRFGNVCDRGCPCECSKAEAKRKKEEENKNQIEIERDKRKSKRTIKTWVDKDYINRVQDACPNLIPIPQTYTYSHEIMRMYCTLCDEVIDKRPNDAARGFNCYNCFGTAFNKKIEGTFYVLKIMDSTGNVIAYKIGITNKTAQERCKTINKSTSLQCEVIYSYSSIGSKVQEIESIIKKSITRNYISKELMNDGSTETFSPAQIFPVIHLLFELTK